MTLAEIIVGKIRQAMLEKVVFDQGLVGVARSSALFKDSTHDYQKIVEDTVVAYGNKTSKLAYGLYKQIHEVDLEAAALLLPYFQADPDSTRNNQQASLVGRAPTIPMRELNDFSESVKYRVCLVLSRESSASGVRRGTGFLVGPDLVLTCRHVLRDFLFPPQCDVHKNGGRIEIYFDFMDGNPIDDFDPDMPGIRKVDLHADWHVASSEETNLDGKTGNLDPEDLSEIAKALDFVLLRLDTKVGLQPVDMGGGRRRGWVTLPDNAIPENLVAEDWIIIPQHPHGFPQRIDFGRYQSADLTQTRIRYRTNAAQGSSGAPCFNQKFLLVGVHNAFIGPEERPLANQAIRLDHIADLVREDIDKAVRDLVVNNDLKDPYALRWSVARVNKPPRVVLGREKLLAWLRDSANAKPLNLSDRVYAARAEVPSAGCTFSLDVLHAETRDSKAPRVVYAEGAQQLPATAEDFLHSLIRELGIEEKNLVTTNPMPTRPANTTAIGSQQVGEVDKIERWLSDELPNWLGGVVMKHVEKSIDRRMIARNMVEAYKEQGAEPPADVLAQATAVDPILERAVAWDYAYVVIDCLRVSSYSAASARNNLDGEVRSLIAALVKGKPEDAMHPGLLKLRWMFLGYLPDFIAPADVNGNGAILEELDPAAVGVDDVSAVFIRMSKAELKMADTPSYMTKTLAKAILKLTDIQPGPEARLFRMQRVASESSADLLREAGA